MNYNKDILDSVLKELESERIRREAQTEAEKARVYALLPRVAELSEELRGAAFEIIRASFGKGTDAKSIIAAAKEKNIRMRRERDELLAKNSIPSDFEEVKYSCEICNDTGFSGGSLCSCIPARYMKALSREVNRELRVDNFDFSRFDINLYPENGNPSPRAQMREVFEFCKTYASDFSGDSQSLFMNGGSGLGKTFLASCIAKEVANKNFSVVFDSAFSILGRIEDVKFSRSDEDISVYKLCDLLIIDDIGGEMPSPFANAALLDLINHRMREGKATIAISTLTSSELLRRYGAQTVSRLEGGAVKLQFIGEDIRLMF